jgi:hypothetical protein
MDNSEPKMNSSAREPLIGWMILEDYCEDMSHWGGVISYPDPTGANLAWLNPTKMIEYSVYQQACKERDHLREALEYAKGVLKQCDDHSCQMGEEMPRLRDTLAEIERLVGGKE